MEAIRKRRCGCYSAKQRLAAKHEAGFTLVELLVVMAIIAILAGLLTPAVIAAMRKAHEASTQNTIHQVDLAAHSFFNDKGDYPPSTWADLNKLFKVDLNGGGYAPNDPGDVVGAPITLGFATQPSTINQGIEVLTACLATQNGGPYLEPSQRILRNRDGVDANGNFIPDTDTTNPPSAYAGAVQACTNWYFTVNAMMEIMDWWENPLVYFHNRDYALHDGWHPEWTPPSFEVPQAFPPASPTEAVYYADLNGNPLPCYGRYVLPASGAYPNLNSFQLFSWGYGGPPVTNPLKPRLWPGWTKQGTGAIMNWEE